MQSSNPQSVVALQLRAPHDVNGNPRRVFVVLNTRGQFIEAIDEGYEGAGALYSKYPQFGPHFQGDPSEYCFYQSFDVSASEYRRQFKREPLAQSV